MHAVWLPRLVRDIKFKPRALSSILPRFSGASSCASQDRYGSPPAGLPRHPGHAMAAAAHHLENRSPETTDLAEEEDSLPCGRLVLVARSDHPG